MGDEANGGGPPKPPSAYVIVCDKEGGNCVELPLESDSALLLNTLQIEYTGAMGIKYRNPATGVYRVVAPTGDKLFPPAGGWSDAHYLACVPKGMEERPWASDGMGSPSPMSSGVGPSAAKIARPDFYSERGGTNFSPLGTRGITGLVGAGGDPTGSPITGNIVDPSTGRPAFSHCPICSVYLNSPDQHSAHFSGKKHKEKEMRGSGRGGGGGGGGFRGRGGGGFRARGRGGPPPFRGRGGGGGPPVPTAPPTNFTDAGPQGLGGAGYTAF